MPDDQNDKNGKPEDKDAGTDRTDDQKPDDQGNPDDYPADLGDAGKRAIDRMKAERDESKRANAELKAENERLKALAENDSNDDPSRNGGKGDDVSDENKGDETPAFDAEKFKTEVTDQLRDEHNARVLRSEVKRLAEGKLQNASDALLFLDVTDIKPGDNGEFDTATITERLEKLTKDRPYLAAKRFEGGADNGARGDAAGGQISREQLKNMTPAEINKARADGRLKNLLSGN